LLNQTIETMKKGIVFVFVLFINLAYSQVTYFNYFDYSCEWKIYAAGWTGINAYDSYETVYFDGDTTINGNVYYRQFRQVEETNYNTFMGTYTENFLYGPGYVREDNTGKIWYLANDSTEYLNFDNQAILSAQVGDTFPYQGSPCQVQSTQTVMLGTTPLKQVFGSYITSNSGIVEGIGVVGNLCSTGVEYERYLNCYSKQTDEIQFHNLNCTDFPVPVRLNVTAGLDNMEKEIFELYPNPTNGILHINSLNEETGYKIFNNFGSLVGTGDLKNTESSIDISTYNQGIYFIAFKSEGKEVYRKIIKL